LKSRTLQTCLLWTSRENGHGQFLLGLLGEVGGKEKERWLGGMHSSLQKREEKGKKEREEAENLSLKS